MTFVVIIIVAIVLCCVFFNSTTTRIRKINNVLNKDRSVCDFINDLDGWQISPTPSEGLRIVITPPTMPIYYLYILYNGERPSNEKIKDLYYELSNSNSVVVQAHKRNIPYESYVDIATAAALGIPDVRRYRKYREWNAEYQRLLTEYGTNSNEANDYFESFFKQIKFPAEWRRYSEYEFQKSMAEMRKSFGKPISTN